ncbi:unnamed protein product [Allacma fusca]|uniref:Uncharacterized protein n=1 Tax=Allacma fusca TaxID=39272 RepID=A0A8J2PCL4_9HEXA|nr:unnamed protein product [Allacma fusca]
MEEEESQEKIAELEEKKKADLKYKRSFFVRMVSDPKIYNPKIVKARYPSTKSSSKQNSSDDAVSPGGNRGVQVTATPPAPAQNPSPIASWISWPLAFMLQEVVDEVSNEVPFRFRNWESTLTIKPGSSSSSSKTSPDNDHNARPVSPSGFGRGSRSPQQPSPNKSRSPTRNSHYLQAPNGRH